MDVSPGFKLGIYLWHSATFPNRLSANQVSVRLAMGPSLGANISRGVLATSHGVCYVVQTEMSSH